MKRQKVTEHIKKRLSKPQFWLGLSIVIYVACFFYLGAEKYYHFNYDAEDLAIFNNVFYNTSHGRPFWFSIHGGYSYLGDHLEFGILILLPFYFFWQSPLCLIGLQAILLGLSAWPLFLIARKSWGRQWPALGLALIYLANPFLQNVALEEFHLAPLVLFFFFWTVYFYQSRRYRPFLLFFLLTLFTREDAALGLAPLAVLIAWEKRRELWLNKKWWLYPLLLAGGWFVLAMFIIKALSPDNGYRYFLLYQRLFSGPWWQPFWLLIRTHNWLTALGFLLPFIFLPLRRPLFLLIALPAWLQLALTDNGASTLTWRTHYQIFLSAALFLASVQTLALFKKHLTFILILLISSQLYVNFFLGPLQALGGGNAQSLKNLTWEPLAEAFVQEMPPGIALVAPYRLAPHLSNRQESYLHKLVFGGKRHLSTADFTLPQTVSTVIIDGADMIELYLHFRHRRDKSALYWQGAERWRQTLGDSYQIKYACDHLLWLDKNAALTISPFQISSIPPPSILGQKVNFEEITFWGWENLPTLCPAKIQATGAVETRRLWWQAKQKITDDYFLEYVIYSPDGKAAWSKVYPLAWGLMPTHDWPLNQVIGTVQSFYSPPGTDGWPREIRLIKIDGDIESGPLMNTQLILDQKEILGLIKPF